MSEHYNYYIVNKKASDEAVKIHAEKFGNMRTEIHEALLKATGAIAWSESNNWGKPNVISGLIYPKGHEVLLQPHIMVYDNDYYDGQPIFYVRGKMNRKAGKEFNNHMTVANEALAGCLKFGDWIISEHFKVMRTGFGKTVSGGGVAMISTFGGLDALTGENIVIAIPKDSDVRDPSPAIPDSFEPITYGKFYDLSTRGNS